MTRWSLDPTWCRPGNGDWVAGGIPRRLWRLGGGGLRVVDAVERGDDPPSGHEPLTRRLMAAGALHPVAETPHHTMSMQVVIPTRNPDAGRVGELVAALRRQLPDEVAITLVDDASAHAVSAPPGASVIHSPRNLGPGGARNLGAHHGQSDLVMFLDDDVNLPEFWLAPALAHFDDPTVVAVAPRVRGPEVDRARSWWERSEQVKSPLDLGWLPGPVRQGSRISYVPAAAFLVRRQAFQTVGGFDASLRYGEDVDLVWRLVAAGGTVRYEPASVVQHRSRSTLGAWIRQRFHYGTSAAALASRHPGALVAVRVPRRHIVLMACALTRRRTASAIAAVVAWWSVRDLARVLRRHGVAESWRWAAQWSAQAHGAALRLMATTCWRTWWPVSLALGLTSRRARRVLLVALCITGAEDLRWWRRTPVLDPVRFLVATRLDSVAYGAGVWWGAVTLRTGEPLRVAWTQPDTVTGS
jgi:mycofactocin glycosyltransferase